VEWGSVILDGKTLPAELGGVKVTVAGKPAWLSYAGPAQVNFLVPPDVPAGVVNVEVSQPGGRTTFAATIAPVSPELFGYSLGGRTWACALFAGEGVYVAEPGSFAGAASRPAKSGDNLELYAAGLGAPAVPHAAGEVLTRPYPHANPESVEVLFGDVKAEVHAVNMTYAGVWQVNVKVPDGVPSGDVMVVLRVGGNTGRAVLLRIADNNGSAIGRPAAD
jgi:uncharacterized protein (TIGR03437 family)